MDDQEKTKNIEEKEDVHESLIRKETETEQINASIISENLKNAEATEHSFDFDNLEKTEISLITEIKKVKDHISGIDKNNLQIDEFKSIIKKIILSLEQVDEHRNSIKAFVNNVILNEEKLLNSVEHKLKEEKAELNEKKIEDRIREHMYNKGPTYSLGAHKIEMAEAEQKHDKQLVALEKEKVGLNKMLKECTIERKQAKLVHLEMRNIIRCNNREERLIDEIANIIASNNLLELESFPEPKILDELKHKLDDLVKTVSVEIHVIDSVPNQLVDLKKEEHLDSDMMEFLVKLEEDSDIRHKYII